MLYCLHAQNSVCFWTADEEPHQLQENDQEEDELDAADKLNAQKAIETVAEMQLTSEQLKASPQMPDQHRALSEALG